MPVTKDHETRGRSAEIEIQSLKTYSQDSAFSGLSAASSAWPSVEVEVGVSGKIDLLVDFSDSRDCAVYPVGHFLR
jgi:hypothetical protein